MKIHLLILFVALSGMVVSIPADWLPLNARLQWAEWFGASDYTTPPESIATARYTSEPACPEDLPGWRKAQNIEGVNIRASQACLPDNPYTIAAAVLGSNNVSAETLKKSGLTPDAVVKGRDLDGDGDPDEIHIRMEVVELNGGSPEMQESTTQFSIAPGINPGLWVFAPKTLGMATENFESDKARALLRLPAPVIRVEQGDKVTITLENTHYMPHTMHFHGVDHAFLDKNGEGNDGVPLTSEVPLMPGFARSYNLSPRHAGTMYYHCHVQPQVHIMMGLQGMFVVEENRPNNFVQTLNIGAGHVRAPSQAIREEYDREYDLHYQDIDIDLSNLIQKFNDVRLITEHMHRRYNASQAVSDFYTLNGRSFPYTFRESLIVTKPNENIKLRVANGGSHGIALHTHGHKTTLTHTDGVPVPDGAKITRDVFWIATSQRADLDLNTNNDGLHSYGDGVWLLHDHEEKGITNNGIGPGGNIGAIVYESFLGDDGWPRTFGNSYEQYFSAEYYRRQLPVWHSYSNGFFNEAGPDNAYLVQVVAYWFFLGLALIQLIYLLKAKSRKA